VALLAMRDRALILLGFAGALSIPGIARRT
jgi:hypothetical protein